MRVLVAALAALAILALPVSLGAAPRAPYCKTFKMDDTADDFYFETNGYLSSWEFDASRLDSDIGAVMQVSTCIQDDLAFSCALWEYDSNDDGQKDTSYVDGTDGKRGTPEGGVVIPGAWFFDCTTAPTSPDVAVVRACRW